MANTLLLFLLMSICIVVTQTTNGASGDVALAPWNRHVYEGATNTTIPCKINTTSVDWSIYPFTYTGSSNLVTLTNDGEPYPPYNELFATDQSQGPEVHTLVVFNATISSSDTATFSTAGIYLCTSSENDAWPDRRELSQLVVIRADPVCSSNFTQSVAILQSGQVLELSCKIVYGSERTIYTRIDAIMAWSINGQPIPAENATFKVVSSPTEVTASSTLVINENFDATYECETTFSRPPDFGSSESSNAPDYLKTCTISPLGHQTRCSFPFTYNGRINYKCTQSDTNRNEVGCFSDKGVWITCPPSQLNYIAQNATINVTIPTFDIPTQVTSVDNWIVVQQRIDNSTDFRRNWSEYRNGFGVYNYNYWMGLEKIHQLTTSTQHKLRIEVYYPTLQQWRSAEYSSFVIDAEANNYTLHVSGFSGDADNGLQWTADSTKLHDGMQFSAPDVDNDKDPKRHCANIFSSGWWFNACNYVNLNGHIEEPTSAHNYFEYYISGTKTAIAMSRMMIHSV